MMRVQEFLVVELQCQSIKSSFSDSLEVGENQGVVTRGNFTLPYLKSVFIAIANTV